jgi:hypothetical protein
LFNSAFHFTTFGKTRNPDIVTPNLKVFDFLLVIGITLRQDLIVRLESNESLVEGLLMSEELVVNRTRNLLDENTG